MDILYVLPDSVELPAPASDMAQAGMRCHIMQPSFMSAITAMKIARAVDKHEAEAVRLCRVDDAMAAVSARKLANGKFKIIMEVAPGAKAPRSIPRDLLAGVDAWIFPHPDAVWPYAPADRVHVMPPCGQPLASLPLVLPADCAVSPAPQLWIGPIDGNTDRLLKAIDSLVRGQQLRICGTGKARHTMPLVRRSRIRNEQLGHAEGASQPEAIVWLGQNYNLDDEVANAAAIVQSGPTPTQLELRATGQQTPLPAAADLFASL